MIKHKYYTEVLTMTAISSAAAEKPHNYLQFSSFEMLLLRKSTKVVHVSQLYTFPL